MLRADDALRWSECDCYCRCCLVASLWLPSLIRFFAFTLPVTARSHSRVRKRSISMEELREREGRWKATESVALRMRCAAVAAATSVG